MLSLVAVDADDRITAVVVFDLGDLDGAFAELDRRYVAGEAVNHARTWSVIMEVYAALNQRELPATTPDWVNIDHRRGTSIAPGEMDAVLIAAWNSTSDLTNRVVTVYRLSDLGAVISHTAHEISEEGFRAEWRVVSVVTVDGDMVNRCEIFDEADLEAAIERFDQLNHPPPRLENAASQVAERFLGYFASQQWDAMADMLADGFYGDDRRPVVGSGVRSGREDQITDLRAIAELWSAETIVTVLATRGSRLALMRLEFLGGDPGPEAFVTEVLSVVEINGDGQTVAFVAFGPADLDAALAELEARYTAGEAAPYASTWSAVAGAYVSLGRDEFPAMTPDAVSIDHRRTASFAPGELTEYIRAGFDLDQHLSPYIESVHRLNALGAVVAHATKGHSREGFDAEWRGVNISMVQGNVISRSELFDEVDLDVAIARFDELSRPPERPANAASRAYDSFQACFAARDWDTMSDGLAHNVIHDGRRRIVGAGLREGRAAFIAAMTAMAGIGVTRY